MELMLAIGIFVFLVAIIMEFKLGVNRQIDGETVSNRTLNDAKAASRYMVAHYALLADTLSENGVSNGKVVTIPLETLIAESFANSYYSTLNGLRQAPCVVFTWGTRQLQGFVYYRNTESSKSLGPQELYAGLSHIGSALGIYKDGEVHSSGKDWQLSNADALFVTNGIDLSNGENPDAYKCSSSDIANNSFVVNLSIITELPNLLQKDDALHAYPDTTTELVDTPNNGNVMLSDMNMVYESNHFNIMFQNNSECVMDPSNPKTMEDYTTNTPDGCKSRQLALEAIPESNSDRVGVNITGSYYNKDLNKYYGDFAADSIQPTTEIAVGTPCEQKELGKMGRQKPDVDPDSVNNLYVNQVLCVHTPLCPEGTDSVCYMPLSSVSINYNPNASEFTCPTGMFIDQIDIPEDVDPGLTHSCWGGQSCDDGQKAPEGKIIYSYLNESFDLKYAITITPTTWTWRCPVNVTCGVTTGSYAATTQRHIKSVICSNDITKINLQVYTD